MRATGERALVLHGGGSAGNAWEIGVVAGLLDAGLDVTEADLIIGTSAGSTAAAQITGASPAELLAAILAAAPILRRMSAGSSAAAMMRLVISMWFADGLIETHPPSGPTGPVRCWGAAARMAASSSAGSR